MRRLYRFGAAVALTLPLFGLAAVTGGPAVAAPPTCQPTTPDPTNSFPGTLATASNFESGDLTGFNPFTAGDGTVGVSSTSAHTGACAAYIHATSANGSIANIQAPLKTGATEAYADGWFNIASEGVPGNNVPYFRFFQGNLRFLDVFRGNVTGELSLRITSPAGTFGYATLVNKVDLGTWHHLAMHVVPNGPTTGVEIWFDGRSVYAKTTLVTAATTVSAVQLGAEHDQQMGEIYADDVIVKSTTGKPGPIPGPGPGGDPAPGPGVPPAAVTAIQAAAAANPALGPATGPVTGGLTGNGCYQVYRSGVIYWTAGTGAHATSGAIRAAWAALGFEAGRLGYPLTDLLSYPNGGYAQAFQHGSIYWTAATGAHSTSGAIRAAWGALGYERGRLGYPITDELSGYPNGGFAQGFQYGSIYWTAATGAHSTSGAIRQLWGALGFERGRLGYPITNELSGYPNGGFAQAFQNGSIYWTAATGAHSTSGAIRTAWAAQGFERGVLGYPVTNELGGYPNGGFAQAFQRGSIYWTAATGAHSTSGAIRTAWAAQGFESGRLGYPTTDIYSTGNGGFAQNFQGGSITWTAAGGAIVR